MKKKRKEKTKTRKTEKETLANKKLGKRDTALTPAYARAFQNLCPVGHSDAISVRERQTLRSQGQFIGAYQMFAQLRAEVVMSLRVEPFFTDGGTHTNDGETTAGWTAITRSPLGVRYVMFWPCHHR